MPRELSFEFPLPNGLHARPASHLSEVNEPFASEVTFTNQRTGLSANAKSVLELVACDVRHHDPCIVRIAGADEDAAWGALSAFVRNELPGIDDALPELRPIMGAMKLPRMLKAVAASCWPGVPVSNGIGRGVVVRGRGIALPVSIQVDSSCDPAREREKIGRAIDAVRDDLEARLEGGAPGTAAGKVEADIVKAHLAIARDPALVRQVLSRVDRSGVTAGHAVVETVRVFSARLRGSPSVYLRERAADVEDVGFELLRHIYGDAQVARPRIELSGPSVVVAENLSPRQLMEMDRRWLKGLVLGHAGTTSHTVILARSLGVPTLVGLEQATQRLSAGQEVIVDAELGALVVELSPEALRYYALEDLKIAGRIARLRRIATGPGRTADGVAMRVSANVASAGEVALAIENGAEGIGLFRTEMLFMNVGHLPSEQEQFEHYAAAVKTAQGRPVTFRTLDIGGDKPLPYLALGQEPNPFMGFRGVRIYPSYKEVFDSQVRAMLRASALGPVKVMAPMIAVPVEARWVKQRVEQIKAHLAQEGIPFDPNMPLGAMMEVPSAALVMDQLALDAEFFSIGTNDLTQYFMAADRDNPKVAALCTPRHPAVLRFLKLIANEAARCGRPLSLCGEMARDPANLPLLVGLGLAEISVAVPDVAAVKARLSELNRDHCVALLDRAMSAWESDAVDWILMESSGRAGDGNGGNGTGGSGPATARPIVEPDLIVLDVDCTSKEEAIKRAVDLLYSAGRTDRPDSVEEAVWNREAAYSTAMGVGVAVPHCKSDAVLINSIAMLRLTRPIEWGGKGEEGNASGGAGDPGVDVVILLAMRESGGDQTHLKVFSSLARRLVHEEFRDALRRSKDVEAIVQTLRTAGIA